MRRGCSDHSPARKPPRWDRPARCRRAAGRRLGRFDRNGNGASQTSNGGGASAAGFFGEDSFAVFFDADFFAAFFFADFFDAALRGGLASPSVFTVAVFLNAAFFAPRRGGAGAASSSALHSPCVSDFGSRSFGMRAFFSPSVMYGP